MTFSLSIQEIERIIELIPPKSDNILLQTLKQIQEAMKLTDRNIIFLRGHE